MPYHHRHIVLKRFKILDILKSLQSEISAMREEISSLKLENTEMQTDISNYFLQNKLPNSVLDSTLSSSAPLSGNSSPNNPMISAKTQTEVTKTHYRVQGA